MTVRGKVHGKTIELDDDPGIIDGQEVEIELRIVEPKRKKKLPGPPIGWRPGAESATAGLLADLWSDEDDRILELIHKDRKRERREEIAP